MRIFQLLYHYLRTLLETNLLPKNIAQYIVKRRKEKYLKWLVHNSPYYSKYKEIKRLEKQIQDMNGRLSAVNRKLKNKNFVDRAPKNVITHERQKQKNYKVDLFKLQQNLESLQI